MAKATVEEYRLSVGFAGKRRKLLRHSIEEDESLLVGIRSKPRPRHVGSVSINRAAGEIIQIPDRIDLRSLSYHPSGRINLKDQSGKHQQVLSGPPLILLKAPVGLLFHTVASVEQLDLDNQPIREGDVCIDLSAHKIKRLYADCAIGPKGAFDAEFKWPFGEGIRVVYRESTFDFCYVVGEAPPLSDFILNGIEIGKTVLSGTLDQAHLPPADEDAKVVAPEVWSSPLAVARQVRALFEKRLDAVKAALASNGAYHVRMSLGCDGVVAAITASEGELASMEWIVFPSLSVDQILQVVRHGQDDLTDVAQGKGALSPVAGAVYVGTNPKAMYRLVFAGREFLKNRYYRIVPSALGSIDQVLSKLAAQT